LIIDFDDFSDDNNRLDLLNELKCLNSKFKCTIFAIPSKTSIDIPDWIEVGVHGWSHHSNYECSEWSYSECLEVLNTVGDRYSKLFKAPGWQISDGCYSALKEKDYIVADKEYNRSRRPKGLKTYELGNNSWHGHIQNVCGNGLEERFEELKDIVRSTSEFKFISELF